jgi:hypothetical protein
MNEQTSAAESAKSEMTHAQAPADTGLTLRPERLAGSADCLNCGTALQGPFCYYCGQPDRNFMRFFPALMREFFEEFLDLDSRFMRTMKPLLFKPGRLTRDYLEGRRFRYTPPLRLYLFASIGFFLLAANLSSHAIKVGAGGDPGLNGPEAEQAMTPEDLRQKLESAGIENIDRLVSAYERELTAPRTAVRPFSADQIMIDGEPWDRETNPVDIPIMPGFINEWINDEVAQSPDKARRINDNPNLIVEQIFDLLPATMFILLPAVAMLFKLWYLFARRYYIEHLIYSLHNHAFIFVSLILILLLVQVQGAAWAAEIPFVKTASTWLIILTSTWVPVYLLISLRHVYRQGWFMTLSKFSVIGVSYVTLLTFVTSVVSILGFLLL